MNKICKLENVSKNYENIKVIEEFSLEIEKGEFVCISGPSGSGKSTLLNMIGMFEVASNGKIELFGKPLPKINSSKGRELVREKIFYLFQNYALVDDRSIDYNLEIPMLGKKLSKQEKQKLKKKALEKVGLELSLKKKIFQLSGGEQQRISLARGFLKDFEIVLADEPTGSLDVGNRDIVMNILKQFQNEGKTVIIVSHDPFIINNCSRVIRIGM